MNRFNRCCGNKMMPMMPFGPMPAPMPMPASHPEPEMDCGEKASHHHLMHQMPMPHSGCSVSRVVHPAVHCRPMEFHHHHKVEHIIPVVTRNIHHCHTHHEYIICKEPEINEVCEHTHGLQCGKDVCALVQQCHR